MEEIPHTIRIDVTKFGLKFRDGLTKITFKSDTAKIKALVESLLIKRSYSPKKFTVFSCI